MNKFQGKLEFAEKQNCIGESPISTKVTPGAVSQTKEPEYRTEQRLYGELLAKPRIHGERGARPSFEAERHFSPCLKSAVKKPVRFSVHGSASTTRTDLEK
jgi:hypothetical protein